MIEREYIVVSNRVRITASKNSIASCTTGEGFGISKGQQRALLDILHTIEERLFKQSEELMEYDND